VQARVGASSLAQERVQAQEEPRDVGARALGQNQALAGFQGIGLEISRPAGLEHLPRLGILQERPQLAEERGAHLGSREVGGAGFSPRLGASGRSPGIGRPIRRRFSGFSTCSFSICSFDILGLRGEGISGSPLPFPARRRLICRSASGWKTSITIARTDIPA
jgi:hypothetical protein